MRLACLPLILINLETMAPITQPIFAILLVSFLQLLSVAGQSETDAGHFLPTCSDPTYCYKLAFLCQSANRRFRAVVRRRCPCTCEANFRASVCCQNMDVSSECRPLCGYDHNAAQNFFAGGLSCANELPKIALCVAQNQDVRRCCVQHSVEYGSQCMDMCDRGRIQPACTFRQMARLEQCFIQDIPRVLRCFQKNLAQVQPLLRTHLSQQKVCANQIQDLKKLLHADQINPIDFLRRVKARR